jgi:hypothetical protein
MFKNQQSKKSHQNLNYWAWKVPWHYDVENPGLGLEQVQLCGGVKPVIFVMCSKGCLYILVHSYLYYSTEIGYIFSHPFDKVI